MSDISPPAASTDPRFPRDVLVPQEPGIWDRIREGLRSRRGLFLAGLVASIGILFGWLWFGAAILPLLYLLPCVAMMAMCMKGHGTSGKAVTPNPTSSNPDAGLSR